MCEATRRFVLMAIGICFAGLFILAILTVLSMADIHAQPQRVIIEMAQFTIQH